MRSHPTYRPISSVTSRHVTLRTGGQPNVNNLLIPPRVTIEESNNANYFEVYCAMVNFCAVYGCSNRSNRETDRSYFRLPAIITRPNDEKQALSKERRATWLARIRRDDLSSNPSDFVRVCSDHFISGT